MKVTVGEFGNYTFDASEKTITLTGFPRNLSISDIYLVINATRNVVMYRPDKSYLNASITDNVITLSYDTTSFADTDKLIIIVDFKKYNSTTTYTSENFIYEKGSTSVVDLHGKVTSEGQASIQELVYSLDSAGSIDGLLQIFRASVDNIHDVVLAMASEATNASTLLFDMNYISDAAAQADWISSSTSLVVGIDNVDPYEGTACLTMNVLNSLAYNETVTYTYGTPEDWSTKASFDLKFRADQLNNLLRVTIQDSFSNSMYFDISADEVDTWFDKVINFQDMNGYSSVDLSSIQYIVFTCRSTLDKPIYSIDLITLNVSSSYSIPVEVSLYDFGTTQEPTTLGTLLVLDELNNYAEVSVSNKIRIDNVHVHRGSHDRSVSQKLTIGNWYGIYIKKPTNGILHIYGSDSQIYSSGKVYSDVSGTLTEQSGISLGFFILAHVPGIYEKIDIEINGDGNGSGVYLYEDYYSTKQLNNGIIHSHFLDGSRILSFEFDSSKYSELLLGDEEHNLELVYVDSVDSGVTEIVVNVKYNHDVINTYG